MWVMTVFLVIELEPLVYRLWGILHSLRCLKKHRVLLLSLLLLLLLFILGVSAQSFLWRLLWLSQCTWVCSQCVITAKQVNCSISVQNSPALILLSFTNLQHSPTAWQLHQKIRLMTDNQYPCYFSVSSLTFCLWTTITFVFEKGILPALEDSEEDLLYK